MMLNPNKVAREGLAFIGLSLCRKTSDKYCNQSSRTDQTRFRMDKLLDRDYEYILSTNDDGFVVGGGETGEMGKLGATDSAHVEIMRIGTFEPSLGGLSLDDLLDAMSCNDIMIPSMASVRPTNVCLNPDSPPELEARFECCASECAAATVDNFISVTNWQLKFLHCQLFERFSFPNRFLPGNTFHMTMARKVCFRSEGAQQAYLCRANECLLSEVIDRECSGGDQDFCGVCIFKDRSNVLTRLEPNLLEPYSDSVRAQIVAALKKTWCEKEMAFV